MQDKFLCVSSAPRTFYSIRTRLSLFLRFQTQEEVYQLSTLKMIVTESVKEQKDALLSSKTFPSKLSKATPEPDDYFHVAGLSDAWTSLLCFVTVPMWTLLICQVVYALAVIYAPTALIRTLVLLYLPYCIFDKSPQKGRGHGKLMSPTALERLRHSPGLHAVARYFPISLVKTAELSPKQSYIFCYHPHGVISMGASTALSTNGCNFNQVFPGIRRFGITLNIMFMIPLFREWIMALGFVSANRESLASELRNGNSLVLVAGGASEALVSHPKKMSLVGQHRRGFCKLAVECNAQLIPCLGFGENRAFSTYLPENGGWMGKFQRVWYQYAKFSLPILTSAWPNKTPLDVVVGEPVSPRKNNVPDLDPVEDLHKRYWKAVEKLYDQHKSRYGYENIPLELL